MKKSTVWTMVLASNLAVILIVAATLGLYEPYPLDIKGHDYDEEGAPFIAERALGQPKISGEVISRLILIGDAGDPEAENQENLAMLSKWSHEYAGKTTTLFLGDNRYPHGFEPNKKTESEAILSAQLKAGGTRNIVIPGNHDWGHAEGVFIERIMAQQAYVDAWPNAEFYPRSGCPGPSLVTLLDKQAGLGKAVRLIIIDTQWLLTPMERPACGGISQHEVMGKLVDLLQKYKSDHVIVASHHPIKSNGKHGGYKRGLPHKLWQGVAGVQATLGKPLYKAVMDDYARALSKAKPLIIAGGHDHSLQLFEGGDAADYMLVSGAGGEGHVNHVTTSSDSLFAHARTGFTVIDFIKHEGEVKAVMTVVEADIGAVFSMELDGKTR